MAILVSDYPRKQYAGHFEFVDPRVPAEAKYASLAEGIATGQPDALEQGAKVKRLLDSLPPGAVTARVYPDGGDPIEFTGPTDEAEAFVTEAMGALKKAVQ